jgi:hypothetical protein
MYFFNKYFNERLKNSLKKVEVESGNETMKEFWKMG